MSLITGISKKLPNEFVEIELLNLSIIYLGGMPSCRIHLELNFVRQTTVSQK